MCSFYMERCAKSNAHTFLPRFPDHHAVCITQAAAVLTPQFRRQQSPSCLCQRHRAFLPRGCVGEGGKRKGRWLCLCVHVCVLLCNIVFQHACVQICRQAEGREYCNSGGQMNQSCVTAPSSMLGALGLHLPLLLSVAATLTRVLCRRGARSRASWVHRPLLRDPHRGHHHPARHLRPFLRGRPHPPQQAQRYPSRHPRWLGHHRSGPRVGCCPCHPDRRCCPCPCRRALHGHHVRHRHEVQHRPCLFTLGG